ncbi:MAG: hypothetical protein ACK57N_12105 [Planctomycetia bacterium]|jgi:hypothetical protein
MICLSILQAALAQVAGAPPASTPWPALAAAGAIVAAVAAAVAAFVVQARAKEASARLERLEASMLEVAKALSASRDQSRELDLRRVEHALLDLRDLARRVEDRVVVADESRRREELLPQAGVPASLGGGLADRVVSRLLALGYERITFVTPPAELDAGRSELDIVVEARRDGAACKGRVLVRGGRIHDIQIQSAYAAFP